MAGRIDALKPAVEVTLSKTIRRRDGLSERYTGTNRVIDLTPYLGDKGSVSTQKSIYQPCGTWSVTFADRIDAALQDSLYALIEPMDHIEIRAAHSPHVYRAAGQPLPVLMRGFVTYVDRNQVMSTSGQPMRAVTVAGQDWGKLLQMLQIFYEQNYGLGQDLLTDMRLSDNYDVPFEALPADAFVQTVIDKVVNPKLAQFKAASALSNHLGFPFQFMTDVSVSDGVVTPYSYQMYQGSLWDLMKSWSDKYWNELFVQDRADGVYLVYRPMPFKDINGAWIAPGSDPGKTVVTPADIESMRVSRTDRDVSNFYWVYGPYYNLLGEGDLQMRAYYNQTDYLLQNYANCETALYGIRKMEVQTMQGLTGSTTAPTNVPDPTAQKTAQQHNYRWGTARREQLVAYNKDNVVWESGNLAMKGDATIQAGRYIEIDYGSWRASYYATGVRQIITPFSKFETRADVIRGDGFLQREELKRSPYLPEEGRGVYG